MRVDPARAVRRLVLALAGVAALAGGAAAERVQTTDTTKVYREIGEQSAVVTKVAEGTTLTVLKRDGRWLKVRVNGRTGWITRSTVTSLDGDDDVPRNTRRRPFVDGRSQRRGWGSSAPDDRVGADAVDVGDDDEGDDDAGDGGGDDDEPEVRPRKPTKPAKPAKPRRTADDEGDDEGDDDEGDDDEGGDDDEVEPEAPDMVVVIASKVSLYPRASRKAKATRTLRRGAKLTVLERGDTWTRVEFGDDAGYVSTEAVEDFVVEDRGAARRPRVIATKARVGFASLGGRFNSNGPETATNPPANYAVDPTALSVNLGVEVVYAYQRDYYLGGGVEYLGCWSTPGIRFADEDIGFKTHDVDLRVVGGYDLHDRRGTVVWGRLGYHVGITSIANLMNAASIPSETFRGPSLGVGVTMPQVTPKIGARASLDLIYPGTRSQTENNEDGDLEGAMGATLALAGAYAWRGAWNLEAGYRFGYRKTSWSGESNRITGVTEATRTDLNHVLTLGLGREF
jgi:uncharacterized protein YgiM (DUF1202 family)